MADIPVEVFQHRAQVAAPLVGVVQAIDQPHQLAVLGVERGDADALAVFPFEVGHGADPSLAAQQMGQEQAEGGYCNDDGDPHDLRAEERHDAPKDVAHRGILGKRGDNENVEAERAA